jgi:hypothetical protein
MKVLEEREVFGEIVLCPLCEQHVLCSQTALLRPAEQWVRICWPCARHVHQVVEAALRGEA